MLWKSKFVIQQLKHVTYTSAYEMDDENDEERTVWDIAESLEEENLEMVRQVVKALGQERERARSVLEQTWHVEDQGGLTANVDGNLRRHTPSEVYICGSQDCIKRRSHSVCATTNSKKTNVHKKMKEMGSRE